MKKFQFFSSLIQTYTVHIVYERVCQRTIRICRCPVFLALTELSAIYHCMAKIFSVSKMALLKHRRTLHSKIIFLQSFRAHELWINSILSNHFDAIFYLFCAYKREKFYSKSQSIWWKTIVDGFYWCVICLLSYCVFPNSITIWLTRIMGLCYRKKGHN